MDDDLQVFALGAAANLERLPDTVLGRRLVKLDADAHPRFALLLNAINGVVYGGVMGMPEWVMLDCALLPAMFVGLMGPGRLIEAEQRSAIDDALAGAAVSEARRTFEAASGLGTLRDSIGDDEPVPLAEFCAIPAVAPGTIVGYSLYSLLSGRGVVAKALGLAVHRTLGARRQIGVAQYDKPAAIRTHVKLGPLRLLRAVTPLHSRAESTFVYALDIPGETALRRHVDGRAPAPAEETPTLRVAPKDHEAPRALDARLRAGSMAWVVAPGTAGRGDRLRVLIREEKQTP